MWLGIVENKLLLNNQRIIGSNKQGVENAISKFETHPSILSIKENVKVDCKFSFSPISADEIKKGKLKVWIQKNWNAVMKLSPIVAGVYYPIYSVNVCG